MNSLLYWASTLLIAGFYLLVAVMSLLGMFMRGAAKLPPVGKRGESHARLQR